MGRNVDTQRPTNFWHWLTRWLPKRDTATPSGQRCSKPGTTWVIIGVMILAVSAVLAGCSGDAKTEASAVSTTTQLQQAQLQTSSAIGARDTITVVGKAKVSSAPDEAVLSLSVETEAADPAKALDANSQSTQKVIDRLKSEGVEESAIRTANVTVYPIRTYDPKTGKESLTGYRAQNAVTVTLKDALKVGKVLAAAVETGATNISGPEWRLSEANPMVTEALKQAVANARTKAEAVAAAQGVRLGDVVMMNEGGVEIPVVPMYGADVAMGLSAKVAEPPISPGTLDISATMTVTYALNR